MKNKDKEWRRRNVKTALTSGGKKSRGYLRPTLTSTSCTAQP